MCYLVEVVEGLVQVCVHASRWFIGDLYGGLQDTLGDDVALAGWWGLRTNKHSEIFIASISVLLQKFLKGAQPTSHEVDVLQGQSLLLIWLIFMQISFAFLSVENAIYTEVKTTKVWALMECTQYFNTLLDANASNIAYLCIFVVITTSKRTN